MERNSLLRADYLDILFDGRNKAYGSYELRRKYSTRARKACISVVLGITVAAAAPLIASSFAGNRHVAVVDTTEVILAPPPVQDRPKEIIPPRLTEPPVQVATIRNVVPTITPDNRVIEAPPTIDELNNKQPGPETFDGDTAGLAIGPGVADGGNPVVEMPHAEEDKIERNVDVPPEFRGDIMAFLQTNLQYPEPARERGIQGRVGIQFVVDKDGSITEAEILKKASPLLDAEALRVVRIMPKWKPGMLNGKPVKTYFTLPITFTLD